MRRIWFVVVCVLLGVGLVGCSHKEIDRDELVKIATEYVITMPDVVDGELRMTWQNFFDSTSLGRLRGQIPDEGWFKSRSPLVHQVGDDVYAVVWIGVPGCDLRNDEALQLGYVPDLWDKDGQKCYAYWEVAVVLDQITGSKLLKIRQMGGQDLVF